MKNSFEHVAVLQTEKFGERFTKHLDAIVPGVHTLCLAGTSKVVELRFSKEKFTPGSAKTWLQENKHEVIEFIPAVPESSASFYLPYTSAAPMLLLSTDASSKAKVYKKELIRVGKYYKESAGIKFEVTAETLMHWVNTFKQFLINGLKVPIPSNHWDTDSNNGYLQDVFIEGESLFGIIVLYGANVDTLASTNDVSIYCPVEYTDGAGNMYFRPIVHVALTPYPVIPGLKEFEALAASLLTRKESKSMKWQNVQKALNISEELKDENAEALILSSVELMTKTNETLVSENAKLVADNAALTETSKTLALSQEGVEPSPVLVNLAADNIDMKLSSLVSAARITPAVKTKLVDIFVGADKVNLALSLKKGTSEVVNALVAALSENDPVILAEQTGVQTLTLSKQQNTMNVLLANTEARVAATK